MRTTGGQTHNNPAEEEQEEKQPV
jgi:hypothetical protein